MDGQIADEGSGRRSSGAQSGEVAARDGLGAIAAAPRVSRSDGNGTDAEFGGSARRSGNGVVKPGVLGWQEGVGEPDFGIQIESFGNGEEEEAVCRREGV